MAVEFIVVEGADAAGKKTQTKLLKVKLESAGHQILMGDFPRYEESHWGKLVGRFLKGEFGGLREASPYLAVLPYMLDESDWSERIAKPWIKKGGKVLSNRFFTSNVHQVVKFTGAQQDEYRTWLWNTGYNEMGILKPDLVLVLDVDPRIAQKLNEQKEDRSYLGGKGSDIAERDFDHQLAAYEEYLRMTETEKEWKRVQCTTKGELDSIDTIHGRIWGIVGGMMGLG